MSAELIGKFWVAMLCAPGVVPAVIFYRRHCKETPPGENRFPLSLYVVALLICAFVAFWGGTGWGVRFACSGPSSGNLCGLLGFIVVGPLSSIIAVSVLSWLLTYFPLQMKRLVLTGVLLFLLAGGYYFRGFFLATDRGTYQHTLQSDNLDELNRFAPLVEADMRRLTVNGHQAITISNIDRCGGGAAACSPFPLPGHPADLPGVTISYKLAPGATLDDALTQIETMEKRLALPPTVISSFAKAK
jgi:hypothetical protein